MATRADERRNGGVRGASRRVAERASALIRLELELAGLELKRKFAAIGLGIGLALAAAVVGVFMIGFLFATLAAVLATFLALWLALLIVTLFLAVLSVLLGLGAVNRIKHGTPLAPEQAIHEAKLTGEVLKR